MTKSQKNKFYGIIVLFAIFFSLLAYAKAWEALQSEQYLSNCKIRSIEQYCYSNDLHWSLKEYRIYIVGENKPIDFQLKNWDDTVQVGDTVDLKVKRSFPWLGSKGEINGVGVIWHKIATVKPIRHVKTQKSFFDE